MGQVPSCPANRQHRWPGLRMALLLSLAIHSLFALALWAMPAARVRSRADAPLAEVPVVVVPVEQFTVSLTGEPVSPLSKPAAQASEPEPRSEPVPISVDPLPLNAVASEEPGDSEVPPIVEPARGTGSIAAGGQPGNGSGEGSPAFFGVPVQARRVVYVIDRSMSMGFYGRLAAAKRELLASLDRLPATTRFAVLFYNREVLALPLASGDGLLANSEENRKEVTRLVQQLLASGGTDHVPALRKALSLRPDVIFFMTDAEDLTRDQVSTLTKLNTGRTVIHTLEWTHSGHNDGALKVLADFNRGSHLRLQ